MEDEDYPRVRLEDFFTEVMEHHIGIAISRSGMELAENPDLGERVSELLKKDKALTMIVLGIAAKSGGSPPHVFTTLTTGFMMGVAVALELLNEKEKYLN